MLVLSVYRDRILRMYQRIDQFDLFFAGMSGNMHILEDHVGSLFAEFIDDIGYRLFISRDRMGTENDGIVWLDGYLAVGAICHTRQSCHRLALAAGRDQYRLFIRVIL